jgi:N-carbamoyl-L-amino-acid hydrolase
MSERVQINGRRLWQSLMVMAEIGATAKGGCRRLALGDEDKAARDLFRQWCQEAGCRVTVDEMGNMFARRPGRDNTKAPVGAGSHLDTQPHGGKFDGVFGVLAALEVVRALNEAGIETAVPLEIVNWTNEEGARFAPGMLASGVFGGVFDLEYALSRVDLAGKGVGQELARIGYAGDVPCGDHAFTAFFEAHIEQGPILEREQKQVGVVTAVQGFRWYDVTITGQDAHAGSTPMHGRRDALLGAAQFIQAVNELALTYAPDGRGTVGQFQVSPNSRNTIPGRVDLTIDMRHPEAVVLTAMDGAVHDIGERIATEMDVAVGVELVSYSPPVVFDEGCITAVQTACQSLGIPYRRMISGAGHDACYISRISPTSMIFVPCAGGISHNEAESARPEDLEAGANVLLRAILHYAG